MGDIAVTCQTSHQHNMDKRWGLWKFSSTLPHPRGERVPGNGNGNAGNRPIRFRRISDYDPFLDMDSLIAQIPCLVGSSQPLLLVYTVLHKGWISEQIVSVPGVRS